MARQTLNNVVSYLETQLATDSDLDKIEYTDTDTQTPAVKKYGAHIYLTDPGEVEQRYIGKRLNDIYKLNLDIIINRSFKTGRLSVSDAKGVSYWKDRIQALLLHGSNNGVFEDSFWEFEELVPNEDRYIIKGMFTCEVLNDYSS